MSQKNDQANFCTDGHNALLQKDYRRAEDLLLKALQLKDYDIFYYHLTLSSLIKLYFKMRDTWEGSYDKCLHYCHEDLRVIFSESFLNSDWNKLSLPRCIAINRLAINYENTGQYEEAIALCENAISLGFTDNTKGGYQRRIEKIKKKMGT